LGDFGFGIEIEGLVAQMEAGIRRELQAQHLDGLEQLPGVAALRRPGSRTRSWREKTVVMPLAIACRSLSTRATSTESRRRLRASSAARTHRLQVDDARQHQAACIDAERASSGDDPELRCRGRRSAARFRQTFPPSSARPPSIDILVMTTALRCFACERPAAASYFARKSSTANLREVGQGTAKGSWSQSHQARSASRLADTSGNRRR
jgi:hypothetical protein